MRRVALAATLIAVAATGAAAIAQRPTFSARLDVIRVDALVTEDGRPLRGLVPANFDILDNGVPQRVDLVNFEELPLNVVLAFDASASMAGERLGHLRDGGRALLASLRKDDKAALVGFSHRLTLTHDLTGDVARLRTALDAVEPYGATALVDGTYAAMRLGGGDAGRDMVIVFSDGVDTASWLTPAHVLDAAKRLDVTVYGVSIRGGTKASFLADLAELTGGGLIEIASTKDLTATFVSILEEFRQRYVVSYTPRGVAADGWHRIDVRVKGRRGAIRVKARPGYFVAR